MTMMLAAIVVIVQGSYLRSGEHRLTSYLLP